jgi:hypothetical protein
MMEPEHRRSMATSQDDLSIQVTRPIAVTDPDPGRRYHRYGHPASANL